MNNQIVRQEESGNCYFISDSKKMIYYLHPEMYQLMCNGKKSIYYEQKFTYLKQKGLFDKRDDFEFNFKLDENAVSCSFFNSPRIIFEVTSCCNLKCKYCCYGDLYENGNSRKLQNMDAEIAVSFIDYYYKMCYLLGYEKKALSIGFYGGEPLLNFNLIKDIVSYLEDNYPLCEGYTYFLTTNGVFLDKYIDYLVSKNFSILISLDGDKLSSSYRVDHGGRNVFDIVDKNIQYIRKNYSEFYKKRISFNSVYTDLNSKIDIYNFFRSRYDKIPTISPLSDVGVKLNKRKDFSLLYAKIKIDKVNPLYFKNEVLYNGARFFY